MNMKLIKKYILTILIANSLIFVLSLPALVTAQSTPQCPGGVETCTQNNSNVTTIPNPLDPQNRGITPAELAGRIIRTILGITGAAALIVFIYGGVLFMFSGGNANKVQTAKNVLIYAALGLAIIFASYAILQFVLEAIVKATGG